MGHKNTAGLKRCWATDHVLQSALGRLPPRPAASARLPPAKVALVTVLLGERWSGWQALALHGLLHLERLSWLACLSCGLGLN